MDRFDSRVSQKDKLQRNYWLALQVTSIDNRRQLTIVNEAFTLGLKPWQ